MRRLSTLTRTLLQPILFLLYLSSFPPVLFPSFLSIPFPSLSSSPPTLAHAALLDQCAVSLASLFTDPRVTECLPLSPMMELFNATFDSTSPATIQLANDTAASFCVMPICKPRTVSLLENTIRQNCLEGPEEAEGLEVLFAASALYVPFKQGLCQQLDPPRNGTFCVTVMVESMSAYLKENPFHVNSTTSSTPLPTQIRANPSTIPSSNATSSSNEATPSPTKSPSKPKKHKGGIMDLIWDKAALQAYVDKTPQAVVCTPCNKAMINPINNYVSIHQLELDPDIVIWVRNIQSAIISKCGDRFVDGVAPPSLVPTTTTSTASLTRIVRRHGRSKRRMVVGDDSGRWVRSLQWVVDSFLEWPSEMLVSMGAMIGAIVSTQVLL